ncbi:MAG TPA: plastocyanin/azurin family copper-binding protein [Actinomycetota bacterium]|nr:plastocyanin/azurin family copper-binding protein [Actinomycetota bacterium]
MRHHFLIAGLASACLVLSSACGSAGEPARGAPAESPTPSRTSPDVRLTRAKIVDTDFLPKTIEVTTGGSVRWEQVGDQPHSVTAADDSFDSSPACGPLASDRCLGMGDTFVHRFDEPGTFTYYCRVHGLPDGTGMSATVVVKR